MIDDKRYLNMQLHFTYVTLCFVLLYVLYHVAFYRFVILV